MLKAKPDLQIVTIESPCDSWHLDEVRTLFGRIVGMRLRGYRAQYPDGVLPLDAADFAGDHHAVCVEGEDGWIPLLSHRTTTLRKARRHGLPFGGMSLARSAGGPEHVRAIERITARCEEGGLEIAYIASAAMEPDTGEDAELRRTLRELLATMMILWHHEQGIRVIGGGTIRFKMDERLASWGFEAVHGDDGRPLPPMTVPFLVDEPVRLMYAKRFRPGALEMARTWDRLWSRRLELGTPRVDAASDPPATGTASSG